MKTNSKKLKKFKSLSISNLANIIKNTPNGETPDLENTFNYSHAYEYNRTEYFFNDVNHALSWSTEILRKQRNARISNIYSKGLQAVASEMASSDAKESSNNEWYGEYGQIPTDFEDRKSLAMQVHNLLIELSEEEQLIIKLRYWGDYYNDRTLRQALNFQERIRISHGKRVRINYRYSYQQVGVLMKIDRKTASRRLNKVLNKFSDILQARGLLL